MGIVQQPSPQSDRLRLQLNLAHEGLLTLHKSLLDHERVRYEKTHPRIESPGQFLQLLIHDPFFAWLRPVSQLIAQIDEFVSAKEPVDPRDGEALLTQSQALVAPVEGGNEFQREYFRSIQESAEVALLNSEWKRVIAQMDLLHRDSDQAK